MHKCPKCGGKGHIPYYNFWSGGICFRCNGSGVLDYDPVAWTKRKRCLERRLEMIRRKEAAEEKRHKEWVQQRHKLQEERKQKVMSVIPDRKVAMELLDCLNWMEEEKLDNAKTREEITALVTHFYNENKDIIESPA